MEHKNVIAATASVKMALEKISGIGSRHSLTLFVVDDNGKVTGSVTDGDIRRGLLNDIALSEPVEKVMNRSYKFLKQNDYSIDFFKELKRLEIDMIPLVDEEHRFVKVLDLTKKKALLPVEAVIMAGGEGRRLKPLTDTIPKPLLPVNNKAIIEYNIDRLESFGINNFFISVNYLKEKIIDHLGDGKERSIRIRYLHETAPLGTIGAVSAIEEFYYDAILLMNSDLLTNIDFADFYKDFQDSGADMAVATYPFHLTVPYGVFEVSGNIITSLKEKPTYTYQSNAGIYLIKREALKLIPVNTHYNATDLMEALIAQNKKVINFQILGYWLDIGKPEDYLKAQEDIKHIHF